MSAKSKLGKGCSGKHNSYGYVDKFGLSLMVAYLYVLIMCMHDSSMVTFIFVVVFFLEENRIVTKKGRGVHSTII